MNLAHVHIVLNHIPSLGCLLGLLMLGTALYQKDDNLKKYSFGVLVLIAMLTLPTYVTGNGARRFVLERPGVSLGIVEVHQNAAMLTLVAMTFAGTFAWFGLWEYRRFSRAGALTSTGTLLSTIAAAGLILYTAGLGGKISHPEIREAADAAITEEAGWRAGIELFANNYSWVWPASESLHFIGMALLFGVSLLLLLRMLGMMKSIPFTGIHRLLPLGILGFVINVFTGMLFFVASPGTYISKDAFVAKIVCILIAAVPLLYFTMFDDPWKTGRDRSASVVAKIAAVCTFSCLLGVMVFGRLLPFFN